MCVRYRSVFRGKGKNHGGIDTGISSTWSPGSRNLEPREETYTDSSKARHEVKSAIERSSQ